MAVRFDPIREMDRLVSSAFDSLSSAAASRVMPMDLYREGENFIVRLDMPGVNPASLDVDVEDKTLTVRAERAGVEGDDIQWLTRERPIGTFARQLTLGRSVDVEHISADYADGVLTLTIPVAEDAKPRKIKVAHSADSRQVESGADKSDETSKADSHEKSGVSSHEVSEGSLDEKLEHAAQGRTDERQLVNA